MPLVKKRLSIAAGATSDQVLAGTTYEYVDPGTRIVVAAAVDTVGSATADTTMDFNVNNAEFSKNASVSALVTGEPFVTQNAACNRHLDIGSFLCRNVYYVVRFALQRVLK